MTAAVVAVAALAGAAGCGSSPEPVATSSLDEGRVVSPKRYLADVAEATRTTRDVSVALATGQRVATPARLRSLADDIRAPVGRATLLAQRIGAAKLADSRLERQRALVAPLFATVAEDMEELLDAAQASDADGAVEASARLGASLDALRGAMAPGRG